MNKLHHAFTATGSIALATACQVKDTIPNQLFKSQNSKVKIGHRSGIEEFDANVIL